MAGDVTGFADRVDVHSVGYFAGHPQHPRIHRRDVDFGVGRVDRPRTPLRGDEVQVVELAVVIELSGPERQEARLHREQVVAQSWARPLEINAVSPNDVGAYLGAQAEAEVTA